MTDTSSLRTVPRRLSELVLDGCDVWGSLSIRPQRWGATSYRLVVYPPVITAEQRRRVRLWRGFYAWGTALWLSQTAVLSGFTTPWAAVLIATITVSAAGAAARVRARTTPKAVRCAEVTVYVPYPDAATLARARLIESLGADLTRADVMLRDGRLTRTQHEAMWWHVYEQLKGAR